MRKIEKSQVAREAVSPVHDSGKLEKAKLRFQAKKQKREDHQ